MYSPSILFLVALLHVCYQTTSTATVAPSMGDEGQQLAAATRSIVVELKRHQDFNYYSQIEVGTPPQSFDVVFETASLKAELSWLVSEECNDLFCRERRRYNITQSSTAKRFGEEFIGEMMSGSTLEDTFVIGNTTLPEVYFVSMARILVNHYLRRQLRHAKFDGVITLHHLSPPDFYPFTTQLYKKGSISEEVFSIHLKKDTTGRTDGSPAGHIILGPSNNSHYYIGEINYVDFYEPGKLALDYSPRALDRSFADLTIPISYYVELSVNILAADMWTLRKIGLRLGAFKVSESKLYRFAGCYLHALPDLKFELGGHNYTLTPEEYVLKETVSNETVCYLGIASTFMDRTVLLGAAFIRKYYTVFDLKNGRYGFADSIDADVPSANK